MQRQAVRSREQHLEENEKVEQIAGEERTVDPHEQELKQGMEKHPHAVPAGQREYNRGRSEETRQQQHEGGQPVHHEHDSERGGPVAQAVHARHAGRSSIGSSQQRDRNRHQREGAWRH